LEGRELAVMGWMRRRGALDLLVVLPDGSRALIAAAWTDLEGVAQPLATGMLGSVEDLLAARRVLDGLLERVVRAEQEDRGEQAAEGSGRAVALGSGGEPGTGGGAVGAAGRGAASGGDGAAGGADLAQRRGGRGAVR
jgi:hypothetical protein